MKYEDPYVVLNIPYNSSEKVIRKAYHELLREGEGQTRIAAAYQQIYNAAARKKHLWSQPFSYVAAPPQMEKREFSQEEKERLIRELAFLSDWELEEES